MNIKTHNSSYTKHRTNLLPSIDKRSIKIDILSNFETFPFVYSSVSRTYIIPYINIDIAIITMARYHGYGSHPNSSQ